MNLNLNISRILVPVAQFFGILPLNYRNIKVTSTAGDYSFIILNVIIYSASLTYSMINYKTLIYIEDCKQICSIGNMGFICLGFFVHLISLLSTYKKKRFFIHFYDELAEFDARFYKCNPIRKNILRRDYVKIIMSVIMILSLGAAICFDFFFYEWKPLFALITFGIISAYPLISSSLIQLKFTLLIQEIGYRFEKINFIFKIINRECVKKIGSIKIFDIELNGKQEKLKNEMDNIKKSIKTNYYNDEKRNKETINDDEKKSNDKNDELIDSDDDDDFDYDSDNIDGIIGPISESYNCERHMVELFTIHEKLSTLGVVTNKEYAAAIVAYMTSSFIISIFGIFLATKVLFTIGGENHYFDFMAISYVIWTIFFLVVAYLVLRLCCKAQTESRKTALLIHEIMQKKPTFMLGNDEYYNKMKCFTLQYLHWEQYFHFNGIGLFSLDYTFIFSAVSAATSYLIVLLQFDMTAAIENVAMKKVKN